MPHQPVQPTLWWFIVWSGWLVTWMIYAVWYRFPRAKLLQGQDWNTNRAQVYRSLGHPLNAGEAVNALTRQLDIVYRQVAKNFADNQAVSLDLTGKRTKLSIAHLNGLDEPPTLKLLSKHLKTRSSLRVVSTLRGKDQVIP